MSYVQYSSTPTLRHNIIGTAILAPNNIFATTQQTHSNQEPYHHGKIISSHCGRAAYAGENVVASIDLAMATDGSVPLTIDLFHQ